MASMIAPFIAYMKAQQRMSEAKTTRLEEPSPSFPGRMNVIIEANSFDACQTTVQQVMDEIENGSGTFTIPTKAANNQWLSIGHYTKVNCPATKTEE